MSEETARLLLNADGSWGMTPQEFLEFFEQMRKERAMSEFQEASFTAKVSAGSLTRAETALLNATVQLEQPWTRAELVRNPDHSVTATVWVGERPQVVQSPLSAELDVSQQEDEKKDG